MSFKTLRSISYSLLVAGGLLTTGAISLQSASAQNAPNVDTAVMAELSEEAVTAEITATLIYSVATGNYAKPIPDPTGITYMASRNTFFVSDSEVDETSYFSGSQIFEIGLAGEQVGDWSTAAFSIEPTEVETDSDEDRVYLLDDDLDKLFVLEPGPDRQYGTLDDIQTSLSTRAFGSNDPEGLAFDSSQGHLYLLDALIPTLFEITPGNNNVFDGVAPQGDDRVITYDISGLALEYSLKGITFNATNGHLYVTSRPASQLSELTRTGRLVQKISISDTHPIEPSDLVFAPSSIDAQKTSLYVVDRGRDNDDLLDENDGRLFELSIPITASTHSVPVVSAGAAQSTTLPNATVQLSGSVQVDPSVNVNNVVVSWSQLAGPSDVIFANKGATATQANFSTEGTYVLRLLVDDGELIASSKVVIVVNPVQDEEEDKLFMPLLGA